MKCVYCNKKELDPKYKPFCSLRCSQLDLYKWFSNGYSVPLMELDDEDKEELDKLIDSNEEA
jgi:endogenous inhibitor of DNA gyrase (YacG/DUF329 family)